MTMPQHTFAILAYQKSPYIESCILSLKKQTVKSHIVLCTSTPSTYLKNLAAKHNIPIRIHPGQGGIAADWTFAYQTCKTELLTLAHQDDIYLPDYTRHCVDAYRRCPNSLIVFTDYSELRENNLQQNSLLLFVKRLILLPFFIASTNLTSKKLKKALIALANPVCCPTILYSRQNIGPFVFNDAFSMNLDWEASMRLAQQDGSFVYIPQKLLIRRIHPGSESTSALVSKRRQLEDQKLLEHFWPGPVAKAILKIYHLAYCSNR